MVLLYLICFNRWGHRAVCSVRHGPIGHSNYFLALVSPQHWGAVLNRLSPSMGKKWKWNSQQKFMTHAYFFKWSDWKKSWTENIPVPVPACFKKYCITGIVQCPRLHAGIHENIVWLQCLQKWQYCDCIDNSYLPVLVLFCVFANDYSMMLIFQICTVFCWAAVRGDPYQL